jgi:hypothetical protein
MAGGSRRLLPSPPQAADVAGRRIRAHLIMGEQVV